MYDIKTDDADVLLASKIINYMYPFTRQSVIYYFIFTVIRTANSTVQDNQQKLKGVVSFYYTHQITPTCFGS
jgi:hypothetical protein